jgi:hypothetical protein
MWIRPVYYVIIWKTKHWGGTMQGRLMMVEFLTAITGLMVMCVAVYGLVRLF